MKAVKIIGEQDYIDVFFEDGRAVRILGELYEGRFRAKRSSIREWTIPKGKLICGSERKEIVEAVIKKSKSTYMPVKFVDSAYYGRYGCDGELHGAGKFIDCVLCLYGPDGKFHFSPRYQDLYNEGEFDEISDEEFEKYKEHMDAKYASSEYDKQ